MADLTTTEAAFAAWKEFLESTPPNTAKLIEGLGDQRQPHPPIYHIPCPRLLLHCSKDGGERGFDCNVSTVGAGYAFLTYTCRDCGVTRKTFAVLTVVKVHKDPGDLEVIKLGEFPPFGSPISSRISKLLDKEDLELYRKGMRAEAQGLGIGAAGYFRRIVEDQWQKLIDELRQAAAKLGETNLAVYEEAAKQTQFKTAVDMLKNAIPPKLRILSGENPLTLLHQPLSIQLHELTDAECMEQAQDIRIVLTVMLENIADVLADRKELEAAATRLKQGKKKAKT
jgi:hypothetical protein